MDKKSTDDQIGQISLLIRKEEITNGYTNL